MSNVSTKMFTSLGIALLLSGSAIAAPETPIIYLLVDNPTWNQEFTTSIHPPNMYPFAEVPIAVKFKFGYSGGTPNTVVSLDVLGKLLLDNGDTGYRLVTTSGSDYQILLDPNGNGSTNWYTVSHTFNISSTTTHYAAASATAKVYGSNNTPVSEITPTWPGQGIPNPNAYKTPFKVKSP
jgi:hypothetical protein